MKGKKREVMSNREEPALGKRQGAEKRQEKSDFVMRKNDSHAT